MVKLSILAVLCASLAHADVDVHVAAGLSVRTQGFRSLGGDAPSAYNIGVTAATLSLAGAYMRPLRDGYVVGGELSYMVQKALPGIRTTDATSGEPVTTAFSVRDASLRAVGGYELRRDVTLFVRLGLRYHFFDIDDVQDPAANPSRLPSEIQLGPTVGVALAHDRLTSKLAAKIALDTFFAGTSTTQTPGQEDGEYAHASGASLATTLAYRWKSNLAVRFAHELQIVALDFGARDPMSARPHVGMSNRRFDVTHAVTIGLAKAF